MPTFRDGDFAIVVARVVAFPFGRYASPRGIPNIYSLFTTF
jgi:hypothetical protein